MAKKKKNNNLILSGSVKNPVCMAAARAFVPERLVAGGRRVRGSAAETKTMALEAIRRDGIEACHVYLLFFSFFFAPHRCDVSLLDHAHKQCPWFFGFVF